MSVAEKFGHQEKYIERHFNEIMVHNSLLP